MANPSSTLVHPGTTADSLANMQADQVALTGGSIAGADLTPKAGTLLRAGMHYPTGVLTTTPVAGDSEYDGVVLYDTTVASERGVRAGTQIITTQGSAYTLTSQTAAQALFNVPTNGAVTVGGSRTYQFECQFNLTSMTANSFGFGFAIGGAATLTFIKWWSLANKAVLATPAAPQATVNVTAANVLIVTASTATVGWAYIKGVLRINAGGTIIPQVSLGEAAAAVVGLDSYFSLTPLGSSTMVSVGNWS